MYQVVIKSEVSTMAEAKEHVEAFKDIVKGLTTTAGPSQLEIIVVNRK